MKNVNMLFNNKLPTNLYTTFQIIKLLIKKRKSKLDTQQNIHINIIHQISSSPALHTFQHPYIQERRKINT